MPKNAIVVATIVAVTIAGCGARGSSPSETSTGARASYLTTASEPTTEGSLPQSNPLGVAVSVLTTSNFAAFDAGGTVLFTLPAGVLSGDGRRLVRTQIDGDHTSVQAFNTADGRSIATRRIRGRLDVVAVSFDGRRAALADSTYSPTAKGELAEGRVITNLAVVNFEGSELPLTFTLPGNWSPEAFTHGRDAIAAIEFLPPEHPTSYRVRIIDLSPTPIPSPPFAWNTKTPLEETMAGVRGSHVVTEQGRYLYTLYRASDGTAFVHALNLDFGGQYCIDLPASAGLDHGTGAIAATGDGQHLYVLSSSGKLITIDTLTNETNGTTSTTPTVVKLSDLGHTATTGRPSLAVNGSTLYASLDDHLITMNLDTGQRAITTTDAVPNTIAPDGTKGGILAANNQAVWRIGANPAMLRLPAGLGEVNLIYPS